MSNMNGTTMRKIWPGLTRAATSCKLKTRGFRLARSPCAGRLTAQLSPVLIRLLGWYVGLSLKVRATERDVTLSVRRVPSALRAVPPRKQSAADRVRSRRRWQLALQALRRDPTQRRWITGKKMRSLS